MSSLKMHEKAVFEALFNRSGYVLDFTDRTFAEFFREHGINIEADRYHKNGRSKMKRLRAFWEIEPDNTVGQALCGLLEYACNIQDIAPNDKKKADKIICRLRGIKQKNGNEKEAFLRQEFKDISIHNLNLNHTITEAIELRIEEIKKCLESDSPLAAIFLCGSALEGILLGCAEKNLAKFNRAVSSPKDKNGKILKLHNWKLSHLIDAAKELGFLREDVKQFSHSLRDFRNYIHPYQQANQKFNPDNHTAKICFQVLKAAIHQIKKS